MKAFPQQVVRHEPTGRYLEADEIGMDGGMTLRDWFAGQALVALAGDYDPGQQEWRGTGPERIDVCAKQAYRFADAMLRARDE